MVGMEPDTDWATQHLVKTELYRWSRNVVGTEMEPSQKIRIVVRKNLDWVSRKVGGMDLV